jgi:hypothetical protein
VSDGEFEPCCEQMEMAVRYGFVLFHGEHVLPARKLTDVNPDALAGNVLTGESYDPADYELTLALQFCPWCALPLAGEDDWLDEDPLREARPVEDTRPL